MDTVAPSGARARTRRAILDAALTLLAKNPAASLADIATAAGVGRTTIHRYFPERSDLLQAIGIYLLERIDASTARARLDDGPAGQALERVCQEYFDLGDILLYAFDNMGEWAGWETESESDRALTRLVERGHADGTIDPRLPPPWVAETMWALLYVAWQRAREGQEPKHTTLDLCLHTLRKAVAPS